MKSYFAYIRVSTQKQGLGVSLQEQQAAIGRYAERHGLKITSWFEERETAAKRGRPVFGQMLKQLRRNKADGIIVHKIDRSARNLKDWADLGELIDSGREVHFATEALDLTSRGGRLSADIQAVVAADYIRNLREETRKGFYGRLRQGLYPMRAPIGYVDRGGGKAKEPDPAVAPLIRKAFELYASGAYSLFRLREEMTRRGLRNHANKPLSINGVSRVLNNPFYMGIIRIDITNETFQGVHAPIVAASLFKKVQLILRGRCAPKNQKHSFLFRRMLRCLHCAHSLSGELQKGHVYYSCHTPACPTTGVREEYVEGQLIEAFRAASLTQHEASAVEQEISALSASWADQLAELVKAAELQQTRLQARRDRLLDAYMDHVIDKETFDARRSTLLLEETELRERAAEMSSGDYRSDGRVLEIFELAKSLETSYLSANADEKRDLVDRTTSNRLVDGKHLVFELKSPFQQLANRSKSFECEPRRVDVRTLNGKSAEWAQEILRDLQTEDGRRIVQNIRLLRQRFEPVVAREEASRSRRRGA